MNDLLNNILDKIKGYYFKITTSVKTKILGENNEKLDFLLDSFYKLSPEEKNRVFLIGIGSGFLILLIVFVIYFSAIDRLDNNLSSSFEAINKLSTLKVAHAKEKARYDSLISDLQTRSTTLRVKPFFEQLSKTSGIYINGLRNSKTPIPADNPLSSNFEYLDVEMDVSSRLSSSRSFDSAISLPKLLNFINDVEKSDNFFRVKDLSIRSILGDKLYFNVKVSFRTYVPIGANL